MARLGALSKMLYFPTPQRVVDLITLTVSIQSSRYARYGQGYSYGYNRPYGTHRPRILDVCAGEGDAVASLAAAWKADAYGVELDGERAKVAATKLTQCLHGSYHQLELKSGSFNILFLNPPYDEGESDGYSTRQELQFLFDTTRYLVHDGLLIFIPPRAIIKKPEFHKLMREQYRHIKIYDFPHPEVEDFDQVVVIAEKFTRSSLYARSTNTEEIETENLPVLGSEPWKSGDHYLAMLSDLEDFKLSPINPMDIAPSWRPGAQTLAYALPQWDVLVGQRGDEVGKPLVAPRPGHQAMLLAAGALNGAELTEGKLIKGGSEKTVIEIEGEEETIEREKIVSRLSVLDLKTGEYETWRVDEDADRTAEWFKNHGTELADAILKSHTPAFDGDLTPYEETFAKLKAPGILPGHTVPAFLEPQKEAAAAIAFRWKRQGQKSVILSGEMGVGKTSCAILACELAGHKKVVVICPSHLVPKWIRECEKIIGKKGIATTAKALSEVDAFFAAPSEKLRYLILSKERAKLSARWEPAYLVRSRKITEDVETYNERWYRYETKKVTHKVTYVQCPDCGEDQKVGDSPMPRAHFAQTKTKVKCDKCKTALWQSKPISDKGTKRWALARYIRERYARRYALVGDECHQYSSAGADQSQAMQDLITAASKVLAMTGTLYGGRASSIFHLLFKVEPSFRDMYAYDECMRFVMHHGLFETIHKEEEKTSRNGYRKGRTGGRVREIPGMSPAMIPVLLPYTIFLKLQDLRLELPPYEEEVVLVKHNPEIEQEIRRMADEVKAIIREHPKVLGQYLMACLGYPDCPEQEESIKAEDEDGHRFEIASARAFPRDIQPKDEKIIEIALGEAAKGRKVLVYFTQTHRRDARMRVKESLELAGLKVAVLDANVAPDKREAWLEKAQKDGFDVMLTNGRLVETGMDLLFAATIIQYGIEYSVNSLRQSVRRSWRLGQHNSIKVIYLAYERTMQEVAMNLIARKMRAAEAVDGDEAGGLAQFDEGGANFFVELAQEAVKSASEARQTHLLRRAG